MSYLYAVRMLIPSLDPQPIKIGFSTNPNKRRLAYNSGPYPCEWLGVWPGTVEDELLMHMRFWQAGLGLAGEWFSPNDEFLEVVTRKIEAYRNWLQEAVDREARWAQEAEQRLTEGRARAAEIMSHILDRPKRISNADNN